MKKLIITIMLAVAVAIGGLSVSGCKTASGNPPTSGQVLTNSAIALKGVTRAALIEVVAKNGTNAIPYIAAAKDSLNLLIGGTNYTPGVLESTLLHLPIKGVNNVDIQLAVSTILTIYESTYANYVQGQIGSNTTAVVLLSAVRDGASGALALTDASSGP